MSFCLDDSIAALASAPGPGIHGILRVSGPQCWPILTRALEGLPAVVQGTAARRLPVRIPVSAASGISLSGSLLYWPGSRSFTGEPVAEIHLPGSPPLLEEVLERLYAAGARPAERGEFTLRAFLCGRIDLVQAEAVLGVIDADAGPELETALDQLGGGLSVRIRAVRDQLLLDLADLEAGLDFVEEDIDFVSREDVQARLQLAASMVQSLLAQAGERLRTTGRLKVLLAGLPNAGKSTLFNALLEREAALVSAIAGTTRDYLTATLNLDGIACDLVDTAGWEPARDGIEELAGTLRDGQIGQSQLIVWCTSAVLSPEELQTDEVLLRQCQERHPAVMRIITQCDRLGAGMQALPEDGLSAWRLSAICGTGVPTCLREIRSRLSAATPRSEMIGSTAARCHEVLRQAAEGIERSSRLIAAQAGDELIACELRGVIDSLGQVVGQTYTDDLLDRIFSRFCIGK